MAPTNDKLLITGVTGYIGFQTLTYALRQGYPVRGVVRSDRNIHQLLSKHTLLASAKEQGRLELVVVPDFLAEGALVPVLEGITAVVHLASPLAYGIKGDDLEAEVIKPAVDMVNVVLEAAAQVPSVRRVVVTSSSVTLVPFEWNMNPDSKRLYTAADINATPTKPFTDSMQAYWASKAYARLATSTFVETRRPQFDYVNLLPAVVIGPDERLSPGDDGAVAQLLQGTRAACMAPALDASLNSPFPYVGVPVHVADVARAHVDAVSPQKISGNSEFILSSDTPEGVVWDPATREIARRYFPGEVEDGTLKLEGSLGHIQWRIDGMATEEAFGWKFTSFEETMKGLIAQYLALTKASAKKS